ncbi:hypothetical protein EV189_2124 [Motilibacter rhizosphaerae]|uniref:Uncharacterized protein n=1 Tax=Motilibacter rhizosphaerae TaxID=598652 RepID=A0A4V2F4S5_9ACTN|nr:hypothetical protein EV189_2124 [Motilibacter rhizosphaerae]
MVALALAPVGCQRHGASDPRDGGRLHRHLSVKTDASPEVAK